MAYWRPPEPASFLVNGSWRPTAQLDRALPDFNCDRTRFRGLRHDFARFAASLRTDSSKEFGHRWRRGVQRLSLRHGFAHGVRPSSANFSHVQLMRSCSLGAATLAVAELVTLALRLTKSNRTSLYQFQLEETFGSAAKAAVQALKKAIPKPWLFLFVLAAVRWPVLDFLASLERFLLREGHCQGHVYPWASTMRSVAELQWHDISEQPKFLPAGSTVASELLHRSFSSSSIAQLRAALDRGRRCLPLALQQAMAIAAVSLENGFGSFETALRDPEAYHMMLEELLRREIFTEELGALLLELPFRSYPVFQLWLYLRILSTHRFDLPPMTRAQLSQTFAVSAHSRPHSGPHHSSSEAFAALARKARQSRNRRVAIATMSWGSETARRLQLWLLVVQQAAKQSLGVLVTCFDDASLASCRLANREPALCADTRDWPKGGISKLFTVLLCLERGVDTLWLDTDTVVFHDPVPRLRHQVQEAGPAEREMLFSAEADAWTCVNNGVYFVRSTQATRRYLATWVSLYWGRPAYQDQFVLYILLGLLPGMDFEAFAAREGLQAGGPRARALGPLQTPSWGTLDGRVDFTVPSEVNYGGVERGSAHRVAVLHTLESFPVQYLVNQQYHDLRAAGLDLLEEFFKDLLDPLSNRTKALDLLRRNERLWPEERRDCRSKIIAGR